MTPFPPLFFFLVTGNISRHQSRMVAGILPVVKMPLPSSACIAGSMEPLTSRGLADCNKRRVKSGH